MKGKTKDIALLRQDPEFFFRLGMKYANKKMFDKAYKFMKNAVEMKPSDSDYQFNFACILAELKETEKSNRVLRKILKSIDSSFYECYFCMGCNYFDLGKIGRAKEYFKRYMCLDPNGPFADEAYEIIHYLQVYDRVENNSFELSPLRPDWEREWDSVIDCALRNKEYTYKSDYKNELKEIWKNYINKIKPGNTPIIRKHEIWAAVLEYMYCSTHLIKVSKKRLAKKYRISPSSLYSKLKNFSM